MEGHLYFVQVLLTQKTEAAVTVPALHMVVAVHTSQVVTLTIRASYLLQ